VAGSVGSARVIRGVFGAGRPLLTAGVGTGETSAGRGENGSNSGLSSFLNKYLQPEYSQSIASVEDLVVKK
jgi:hypothetical protein